MFSYRKIVFGIKHRYQISDVLKIFKQQCSCSILISQHNAKDVDYCCERPDVHYHGVLEYDAANGGGNIENFLMQLFPYCIYVNDKHCSNPTEYLAYITLSPKRTIVRSVLHSSKFMEYLQTASRMQLEVFRRKKDKRVSIIKKNISVIRLVESLLKYGYRLNDIMSRCKKDDLESLYKDLLKVLHLTPEKFSHNIIESALSVSKKIVINSSILVLSDRIECNTRYLSPEESANFVLDWCSYQNLNPKEFVKNLIRCLDKRGGNRNSIYLQGSQNSGKSYIVQSIIEACIHVGQVVVESSAYSYVWENCVDKRLIVLKEPHFSMINFDQLDKVLSGSGTVIYKHNDEVDYLQPTPVIILANEHDWTDDPKLSETIKKRFLCCYMDLKNFPYMSEKKLHPRWLNILNKTFSYKKSSKDKMSSESSSGSPLNSNADVNNGMKLIIEEGNASSHSLKTDETCSLFTTQISNLKQASENTMEQNPKCRKRPMTDIGHDGEKKKRNLVNQENE